MVVRRAADGHPTAEWTHRLERTLGEIVSEWRTSPDGSPPPNAVLRTACRLRPLGLERMEHGRYYARLEADVSIALELPERPPARTRLTYTASPSAVAVGRFDAPYRTWQRVLTAHIDGAMDEAIFTAPYQPWRAVDSAR